MKHENSNEEIKLSSEEEAGASEAPAKKRGFIMRTIDKLFEGQFDEYMRDWRLLFSYTDRYKWFVLLQFLLGMLSSTLGLVSAWLSKNTINIVTQRLTDKLAFLVITMVASALIGMVFSSLQSRISTKISLKVKNEIRAELFDKLMDADWQRVRNFSTGDILNRLNNDTQTLAGVSISFIASALTTVYSFIISFIAVFSLNSVIAFLALSSAPFLAAVGKYFMKKSRYYHKTMLEKQSSLMSFESETFFNYDTVKSLGAADEYSKHFRTKQDDYKTVALDSNMFSIRSRILLQVIGYLVTFSTFGYCLVLLWSGQIRYGDMQFFIGQRSQISSGFNSILELLPQLIHSSVSSRRVRELMEIPSEIHTATSEEIEKIASQPVSVRLESVDFGYEPGKTVLKKSSFEAHPGEVIAVVGASGQGKTTMLRLILGLICPENGVAELIDAEGNSHPITADHRRLFSYVPQGSTVISGSIADNLRIVRSDATDEQIVDALECACAGDFVEDMGGIDATIGEGGHGISGGQAQRLAIARAILRNAPILLLDEATSNLDVDTEREIIEKTIRHNPGKTCIVSTHRPSVLKLADRIYRVDDGIVTVISLAEAAYMDDEPIEVPEENED